MLVTLRRHPVLTWTAATAAAFAMLAPGANAASSDPLANLKLDSATYELTIKTSRCPAPGDPNAPTCGKLKLESTFKSAAKPKMAKVDGAPGFLEGIRISGSGNSRCTSESAP